MDATFERDRAELQLRAVDLFVGAEPISHDDADGVVAGRRGLGVGEGGGGLQLLSDLLDNVRRGLNQQDRVCVTALGGLDDVGSGGVLGVEAHHREIHRSVLQ